MLFERTPRRGFLASISGLMAAGAAGSLVPRSAPDSGPGDEDKWLDGLNGKYRQIFDYSVPGIGIGLIHIRNYYEVLKTNYGAKASDINGVGTCYGEGTPLAWNDAMWKKYKVGAALKIEDPETKAPLERNWYYRPKSTDPIFFNGFLLDAGMESLMKQGALFLMCNTALNIWVRRLAAGGLGKAEDIAAEIKANLHPGIVVVPGMVVAMMQAQKRGITYMKS